MGGSVVAAQQLYRVPEGDSLRLHHPVDRRAFRPAAEAVEEVLPRIDEERRLVVAVVKRARAPQVLADARERDTLRLRQAFERNLPLESLDLLLGNAAHPRLLSKNVSRGVYSLYKESESSPRRGPKKLEATMLIDMKFPERLATLRKERALTQQALADKVGIHVTQLRRYEASSAQPTLEVVRKLAVALRVSSDLLIFDRDERGPDEEAPAPVRSRHQAPQ